LLDFRKEVWTTTSTNSGINRCDDEKIGGVAARCRFMLRLPPISSTSGNSCRRNSATDMNQINRSWEHLILNVYTEAKKQGGELVGVSVDLSEWSEELLKSENQDNNLNKVDDDGNDEDNVTNFEDASSNEFILTDICTRLRIFRLLLLSVGQYRIRIDLTGLPPLEREYYQILTRYLSDFVSCDVTVEELLQMNVSSNNNGIIDLTENNTKLTKQMEEMKDLANDPMTCSLIFTADISDHLVTRAGALCTRIIGVKTNESMPTNEEEKNDDKKSSIHYFIDDGCYGSLGSSSSQKHCPVPLYGNNFIHKSTSRRCLAAPLPQVIADSTLDQTSSSSLKNDLPNSNDLLLSSSLPSSNASNNHVLATVWGPTCDGLDKVSESVLLPKDLQANRDWLVFSQLGCGGFGGGLGLGTAFNGFDPPDVVYCVLGYF